MRERERERVREREGERAHLDHQEEREREEENHKNNGEDHEEDGAAPRPAACLNLLLHLQARRGHLSCKREGGRVRKMVYKASRKTAKEHHAY